MIGTSQPKVMGDFYTKVLGIKPSMEDDSYSGWLVGDSFLTVGLHSEISGKAKEPARVILNIETEDVKGEFERMKAAGATVVKEPYEMQGAWIATLSDPDGNYFQLMTPWKG